MLAVHFLPSAAIFAGASFLHVQPQPLGLSYTQIRLSALLARLAAAIAILSLGAIGAAYWLADMIAAASHTDSTREREIVVGDDVFLAPENALRFREARRDGVAPRLDLYLRWPELEGYANAFKNDFNGTSDVKRIIFVTLEPRTQPRDMSGRLEAVYRHLVEDDAATGPAGIKLHRFRSGSGYVDEFLMVGERQGESPFVARCLSGEAAQDSLAPCERELLLTDEISLSYRFPEDLLSEWKSLDAAILAKVETLRRTDR